MKTYHIFVWGDYMGSFETNHPQTATTWWHQHRMYTCFQCGEIWARILCDQNHKQTWCHSPNPCDKHGAGSLVAGRYDWLQFEMLPLEALKREFLIAMADPHSYSNPFLYKEAA